MEKSFNLLANAVRFLAADAVQKANSGHPGAPLGMADLATVLWQQHLKFDPQKPEWINRDRVIISNGHASMLLYAVLHLTGYNISLEDIKNFRTLNSCTAGHPERELHRGIETTTGPLGQGFANAVGVALAEKLAANYFNRPNFNIIDHHTYVFVGDGCLMEGISHEVASFAGTLKLGKLIALWDNNSISIDGNTQPWFNEDVAQRFRAYGWHVITNIDGHDHNAINNAISAAKHNLSQPSLICCRTQIGYGSLNFANSSACHGSPLGNDELLLMRQKLSWSHDAFTIPEEIYAAWNAQFKGKIHTKNWQQLLHDYTAEYADLAQELQRRQQQKLPKNWQQLLENLQHKLIEEEANPRATRKSSKFFLDNIATSIPELIGGSADLSESNGTLFANAQIVNGNDSGQYIHYGVREFGMAGIMNGLAIYGLFKVYGGTFLTFADYMRNAIRLSALMKLPVIYIFTHDSIALGEDGPTHQPIEHLAMLRATPNLDVWRPCDNLETKIAWQQALISQHTPSALILTRQNLPQQQRNEKMIVDIARGAYIICEARANNPELIIIATGSEVQLAVACHKKLEKDYNIAVRVVSMPCAEAFQRQNNDYREQILPHGIRKRLIIEAGSKQGLAIYAGLDGVIIGIDEYGKSAAGNELMKFYGFTLENILQQALELLNI